MENKEKIDDGFAKTYGMELLFEEKPKIDFEKAVPKLGSALGTVDFKDVGDGCQMFFFLDHPITFEDQKKVPSQISVFHAEMSKDSDFLKNEIEQSWQTKNAGEIVQKTHYKILVTDFMSSGLNPIQRQLNLHHTLRAIVPSSNCMGIAAPHSQQILDASDFVTSEDPLFGFLNVRFFNAGEQGLLMDSVGLSAIGLYDVQCHFKDLDPNDISNVLYNMAYYIFEENPDFENGHTVAGVNDVPWRVQFENALVPPNRVVLDLDPGKEFHVGERK